MRIQNFCRSAFRSPFNDVLSSLTMPKKEKEAPQGLLEMRVLEPRPYFFGVSIRSAVA